MCQGCSKGVPRVLYGCFKSIPRPLLGCYEGVSRKFQEQAGAALRQAQVSLSYTLAFAVATYYVQQKKKLFSLIGEIVNLGYQTKTERS